MPLIKCKNWIIITCELYLSSRSHFNNVNVFLLLFTIRFYYYLNKQPEIKTSASTFNNKYNIQHNLYLSFKHDTRNTNTMERKKISRNKIKLSADDSTFTCSSISIKNGFFYFQFFFCNINNLKKIIKKTLTRLQ